MAQRFLRLGTLFMVALLLAFPQTISSQQCINCTVIRSSVDRSFCQITANCNQGVGCNGSVGAFCNCGGFSCTTGFIESAGLVQCKAKDQYGAIICSDYQYCCPTA